MLIAQRPTVTEEVLSPQRSRFTIEPLEPGFGYTLGNSLRRVLLSSIPGAAVTSIRIANVLHEFSTIQGVKEDVTELILNIKGIALTNEYDEPVVMYLHKSGPGEVKAGDITPPAGVSICNPDHHLATLAEDGSLEMEFTVERGRGYVSAEMNEQEGQEIGRIPIDSIYSPVLKVSYKVEATRVEQRTDFDRLIMDVETKSSISPRDAMASAGSTLVELFGLCKDLNSSAEGVELGAARSSYNGQNVIPIENLNLTQRSYNCLRREGILTVEQLISHSEQDLLEIRNFGIKSVDELKEKLAEMGLSLRASSEGFDRRNLEKDVSFYSPDSPEDNDENM